MEQVELREKHPLAIRWFHWINFPALAAMVWSGLLIYWANDVYSLRLGPWSLKLFPDWFYHPLGSEDDPASGWWRLDSRLAEGMAWHWLLMWFFVVNGILYVLYTAISGEWRHLLPDRRCWSQAVQVLLHDLKLRKKPPGPSAKYNGAQRIAYTFVVVMGFGSLVTGLAIYKPVQLAWITALCGGYQTARFIHFWLTMGFVAFFVVHVLQVARAGWNNFRAMVTGHHLVEAKEIASE